MNTADELPLAHRTSLIIEAFEGDEFTVFEAENRAVARCAFGAAFDEADL